MDSSPHPARWAIYRGLLDTTPDGIWIIDTHGTIIESNRIAARMLGYSVDELYGKQLTDIDTTEDAEAVKAHMRRLVEAGTDCFETVHRKKDGTTLPVEVCTRYVTEG